MIIQVKFEQAVAFYVLFFVILFVGVWVFSRFQKKEYKYTKEFKFWQCSICTFVYANLLGEQMTVCPQCGSYNKKDVDQDQSL